MTGKQLADAGRKRQKAEHARHLAATELRHAVRVAATAGWSKTYIAEVAGISRQTVHEMLRD